MPTEVILPKVDMDMSHGTLATWHVAEGETVVAGAALFDIETDKAAMEVEAPASGTLQHIIAKPGDRIAVGSVIAWIYAEGEAVGPAPAVAAALAPEPTPAVTAPVAAVETDPVASAAPGPVSSHEARRATPAARRVAREAGIALEGIAGSGPRGRIQRADVENAAQAAAPMASASSAHWTVQPGPLHVSSRKGTGVPLVLLHGFTADSGSWMALEKALGPGRPLIRIDLPGHGKSPRRRVNSFAELARMLVEAFDEATRAHDQVHLLGHSLGGALALAIADIRARKLASLALISPAGLGPEIDADALGGIVRASRAESLAPWLRRMTARPEDISDDYARAAMATRRDPELRAAQAAMSEALFADGVQCFDLRAALGRLSLPAKVIWGRQDHILPQRQALVAEGECAIHLLSGAGHVPQIECPDRLARILGPHMAGAEVAA